MGHFLFDLLGNLYPIVYIIVLGLGTLLFGFCSFAFFAMGDPVGGAVFLAFALVCFGLFLWYIRHKKELEIRKKRTGMK